MYSQSQDKREQILVQLVHDPAIPVEYLCRKCGYTSQPNHVKRNMVRHLRNAKNKDCLELYSGSSDPREMAWVRAVQEH